LKNSAPKVFSKSNYFNNNIFATFQKRKTQLENSILK
jgi:hypothetical protein